MEKFVHVFMSTIIDFLNETYMLGKHLASLIIQDTIKLQQQLKEDGFDLTFVRAPNNVPYVFFPLAYEADITDKDKEKDISKKVMAIAKGMGYKASSKVAADIYKQHFKAITIHMVRGMVAHESVLSGILIEDFPSGISSEESIECKISFKHLTKKFGLKVDLGELLLLRVDAATDSLDTAVDFTFGEEYPWVGDVENPSSISHKNTLSDAYVDSLVDKQQIDPDDADRLRYEIEKEWQENVQYTFSGAYAHKLGNVLARCMGPIK